MLGPVGIVAEMVGSGAYQSALAVGDIGQALYYGTIGKRRTYKKKMKKRPAKPVPLAKAPSPVTAKEELPLEGRGATAVAGRAEAMVTKPMRGMEERAFEARQQEAEQQIEEEDLRRGLVGASFPTPVEEQSAAGVMPKGEGYPAMGEERPVSDTSFRSAFEPREGTPTDTKMLGGERVVSPTEAGAAPPMAKKGEGEGEGKFPERGAGLRPPALGLGLSPRPDLEDEMMETMSQFSSSGRRRGSVKQVKCTVM